MSRGKYESRAKRQGPALPPCEVDGGVGPPTAAGLEVPVATKPGPAGRRTDLPALGIVVMSSWGWRILAVATMMAVGLCVTFFLDGHSAFGALWAFVAVAWGLFTFRLWRMHLAWDLGH